MVDTPETITKTAAQQIAAIIADPESESLRALAIAFADEHTTIAITTQGEYDNAMVLLRQIKTHLDDLEVRRKRIVDPLNKAKNLIQAEFNPPKERLNLANQNIRNAVSKYLLEQEQKRQEEQRKIDDAAREAVEAVALEQAERTGDNSVLDEERIEQQVQQLAPRAQEPVRKAAGTSVTGHWYAELAVPDDISKVPLEWLMLNDKAVQAHARAAKEQARIPGIVFKKRAGVNIR